MRGRRFLRNHGQDSRNGRPRLKPGLVVSVEETVFAAGPRMWDVHVADSKQALRALRPVVPQEARAQVANQDQART